MPWRTVVGAQQAAALADLLFKELGDSHEGVLLDISNADLVGELYLYIYCICCINRLW